MAQATNIGSAEELRSRLKGMPREWVQLVAVRCALRAMPALSQLFEADSNAIDSADPPRLILSCYRVIFVSWAAGKYPAHDMIKANHDAAYATYAASAVFSTGTNAANAAADAAAYTSTIATDSPADDADAAAARAINWIAGEGALDDFWMTVESDIQLLESLDEKDTAIPLLQQPLWPEPPMPPVLSQEWSSLRSTLQSPQPDWSFWIDWYEARLAGGLDEPLPEYAAERFYVDLALRDKDFWDRDPVEVNAEIVKNYREYVPDPNAAQAEQVNPVPPPRPFQPPSDTRFQDDKPEGEQDHLGRADIAFLLAGRLNQIWDNRNQDKPGNHPEPPFVGHIDAPWGGGKSTFANYVIRLLNPHLNGGEQEIWKKDFPVDDIEQWRDVLPWHIVQFNAWQKQHVRPPWWVFYQAVRKQCLDNVWHGRFSKSAPRREWTPGDKSLPLRNGWFCISAWISEFAWRLWVPANRVTLISSAVVLLVLFSFWQFGWLQYDAPVGEDTGGWNWVGYASAIVATLTFARTTFATFTQSLFSGTPDAAKNYSMGEGDPLEHLKIHFDRFCRSLERPILVIVDDLDRCEPDYVVELMRGFQTVLASERMIILLLGDRDWLEESFVQGNKTMKDIDVGPEHGFGARFVEKVIQLSITLPEIGAEQRKAYLNTLLGSGVPLPLSAEETLLDDSQRARIEQTIADTDIGSRENAALDLIDQFNAEIPGLDVAAISKTIGRKISLKAATDQKTEEHTSHQLQGLAPLLPPNPRQIKRIINTVVLVQGIAWAQFAIAPATPEWRKLARWIVLMVEWPQTWFTLANDPDLIGLINELSAKGLATGETDPRRNLAAMIASNETAMKLLNFDGVDSNWRVEPIMLHDIETFCAILPATSGKELEASGDSS